MADSKKEKRALRKKIISLRDSMKDSGRVYELSKLEKNLESLGIFSKKRNVMIYLSYGSEIDTSKIIKRLIDTGSTVYVPRVNDITNKLDVCRYTIGMALKPEKHGIMEPLQDVKAEDPEVLDVIISPGVAFTKNCKRLGYGGGYYDKLFEDVRSDAIKLAMAFSVQVVDSLPVEIHDVRLDYVITPEDII